MSYRDRSPINTISSSSDSDFDFDLSSIFRPIRNRIKTFKMASYSDVNTAKEIIPKYEGGSKNLSYFIQQCEKFIEMFKNRDPGQENCVFNKLLFELCCSKLTGVARDTLVISNCITWSQLKDTLLNRFGDQRNETLLANELSICYQETNESYDQYYEKIKYKLQQLLEHVSIREINLDIKTFKANMYSQKALDTFKAGLCEPYRSFISYKTVISLEDCIVQLRGYDNQQQQIKFLNFMRQKVPLRTTQKPNNTSSSLRPQYYFKFPQNSVTYPQQNLQNLPALQYNKPNTFIRGVTPNNSQVRPTQMKYYPNFQGFDKKTEPKPTPMSISTNNTTQKFDQNRFKPQQQKPNFLVEELFNVEPPNEQRFEENQNNFVEHYDEIEQENEDYEVSDENFRMIASNSQNLT